MRWLVMLLLLSPLAFGANAVYLANAAAGGNTGVDCANGKAYSYFNSAGNWSATPTGIQIGPDTTVHLCGTLSATAGNSVLTAQGSGSSGHPVTILFETGSGLTAPYYSTNDGTSPTSGGITIDGNTDIVVDGGTACGTAAATCNGTIVSSANGTSLANQKQNAGIYLHNATRVEIKNVGISNIYLRTGTGSGDFAGADGSGDIFARGSCTTCRIHDSKLKDAHVGIIFGFDSSNLSGIELDHNYLAHHGWGINIGSGNGGETATGVIVHDNEITDWSNWAGGGQYHTDGIIAYAGTCTSPSPHCSSHSGQITISVYNNYMHGALGAGEAGASVTAFTYCTTNCLLTDFNNLYVSTGNDDFEGLSLIGNEAIASGHQVYNDVFVGGASEVGFGTRGNVTLSNNIFKGFNQAIWLYDNTSGVYGLITASDHNDFYSNTHIACDNNGPGPPSCVNTLGAWQAKGFDANSVTTDPNLDGTYHLNSGSPSINLGANLTSLGITALNSDKAGTARPGSGAWEAGAYEFTSTTAYFVKNGGSDAAAGTSDGTAWATIAKVNGFTFASGDTIQFKRGSTWNEATDAALTPPTSGTTYTAYGSGALPIFDGQGTVANGINAAGKSNITIDSLDIRRNTAYNVLFNGCNTCSILNSTLSSAGTHGINVIGASPSCTISGDSYTTSASFDMAGKAFNIATTNGTCDVENNTIDLSNVLSTRNVSGIVSSASTTGPTYVNNTVLMDQGIQCFGVKATGSGDVTGTRIEGNSCVGLGYTASCPLGTCDAEAIELTGSDASHEVQSSLIRGNYVKNGSTSSDCIGLFWARSNTLSHNFCIGNSGQNSSIHLSTNSPDNFIYNNTMYGSNYGIEITGATVTGNDVRNNIGAGHQRCIGFFLSATGTYDYNDCYNSSIVDYTGGTDGGHNLTTNPLFATSPPTTPNDFKLQSGSAAINTGVNLGTTYQMTNDSNDTAFPYSQANQNSFGTGWEIGAFQFGTLAPLVNLSPTSLPFGVQATGSSSGALVVTATNNGGAVLNITSPFGSLTGTNANQFSISARTCTATLAVGSACTISITFSPTTDGAKTANLSITDDASGSPHLVPLTGTGSSLSPPGGVSIQVVGGTKILPGVVLR